MDASRPPVTVRDPSGAPPPADLLDAEPPAGRRRRWPAALAVLALLLAGGAVRELGQRAGEAEQRRLDAVVDLSLTDGFAFADAVGARVSSRASLVSLELEVRNDGPRPVLVDRAVVGDFRFVGDVGLEPGQTGFLQLVRTVTCPADGSEPPLDPVAEGLRLQVVTPAGGRSVLVSPGTLPLDRLRTAARRACGYLPMEEAVEVMADAATPTDARMPLTLLLTNRSARHLHLQEVRLAPGLQLLGPPEVPLVLPGADLGAMPLTRRLPLWVVMACDQAPRSPDGALLPLREDLLQVVVGDGEASVGPLPADVADVALLQAGYRSACS